MHPAKSVIFFTITSGAGYGLLVALFVYAVLGEVPSDDRFFIVSFATAFGLVVAGLLSSTLHLGHPERAWRALSQWRTSWLSREGIAALFTFLPAIGFAASWWWVGQQAMETAILGGFTMIFSLAVIWCTGMIYASLKAVPAWNNPWTLPGYLSLAAATGVSFFLILGLIFDAKIGWLSYLTTIGFITFALIIKIFYWVFVKYADRTITANSATGLKKGRISLLEAPHDVANYLMKEMGFQIARKHASTLRKWTVFLGFAFPIIFLVLALIVPFDRRLVPTAFAFVFVMIGTVLERWLFFAEAKHVVILYYGEKKV